MGVSPVTGDLSRVYAASCLDSWVKKGDIFLSINYINYVQGPLLLFLFYCPALDDYNIAEMGCLWVVYTTVP